MEKSCGKIAIAGAFARVFTGNPHVDSGILPGANALHPTDCVLPIEESDRKSAHGSVLHRMNRKPGLSGLGWRLDNLSHFCEPAKRIRQLHLPWAAALGLQETRAADNNHCGLSARRCDVESVYAVKKLHSTGGALRR